MGTTILIKQVRQLRSRGRTYAEINAHLGSKIPKSTMHYWCRDIILDNTYYQRVRRINQVNLNKAREKAVAVNQAKRQAYLNSVLASNQYLVNVLKNKDTAKIALAMLYSGEGGKSWQKASLDLGNSDPSVIKLYLRLLRYCYIIDESKFRCAVQCRADQNTDNLQRFWIRITGIPNRQFYRARIDKRTIGKSTRKPDYKGVCRIDYFSARLFTDIMQTIKIIQDGPLA